MSEENNNEIVTDETNHEAQETQDTESLTEESSDEVEGEQREDNGLAKGDTPEFKWYVAKSMTGQENKVSKTLKERIVNRNMTESFAEILVPEETVTTNAGGRKRTIKKKFFPGYVLLKMIMNDSTWHLVTGTDKITGFLGGRKDKPDPISNEEAAYMLGQAEDGVQKTKTSIQFSEGDSVKVIEGPFASFVGTVEAVNDKGKIKVNVSIFGRPTPVELDFSQVEKV